MQNLEVKDAIITTRKPKSEIKKALEDSIVNGKKNENTNCQKLYRKQRRCSKSYSQI